MSEKKELEGSIYWQGNVGHSGGPPSNIPEMNWPRIVLSSDTCFFSALLNEQPFWEVMEFRNASAAVRLVLIAVGSAARSSMYC